MPNNELGIHQIFLRFLKRNNLYAHFKKDIRKNELIRFLNQITKPNNNKTIPYANIFYSYHMDWNERTIEWEKWDDTWYCIIIPVLKRIEKKELTFQEGLKSFIDYVDK